MLLYTSQNGRSQTEVLGFPSHRNTVSSHPFSHFSISEIEGAVASVPKEEGNLFFNARFLEEIPKKQMLIKDWVTEVYLGVNAHSH